jgi:enoyl-CoA hydratase
VLTGQAGIFSAGYDLNVMNQSMAAAKALSEKGSILTIRMFSFRYPLIAACSGHAVKRAHFYY